MDSPDRLIKVTSALYSRSNSTTIKAPLNYIYLELNEIPQYKENCQSTTLYSYTASLIILCKVSIFVLPEIKQFLYSVAKVPVKVEHDMQIFSPPFYLFYFF